MTTNEKIEKLIEFGKKDIDLISHIYTIQSKLMNSISVKDIQKYIDDKEIKQIGSIKKITLLQYITKEVK